MRSALLLFLVMAFVAELSAGTSGTYSDELKNGKVRSDSEIAQRSTEISVDGQGYDDLCVGFKLEDSSGDMRYEGTSLLRVQLRQCCCYTIYGVPCCGYSPQCPTRYIPGCACR